MITIYIIADTHYGEAVDNDSRGDPNARQVSAIQSLYGTAHPISGTVQPPDAVLVVGDLIHEDTTDTEIFARDYGFPHHGKVPAPCYITDGNHDRTQVRDLITARHGSLNYGVYIGDIWFQFMTENYTSPGVTTPPTAAQITAIQSQMASIPSDKLVFLVVHRSISSAGYRGEWEGYIDEADQGPALAALEALAKSRRTLGIIHGHDHFTHHGDFRGFKAISPGSVMNSPADPPYSVTYPESFIVMRIHDNSYDIASYRFGFDINHVWDPGVWEWSETIPFTKSFLFAGAATLGTRRYSPLVSTRYLRNTVATRVVVNGRYTGLLSGGSVVMRCNLIPDGIVPSDGSTSPYTLAGRTTQSPTITDAPTVVANNGTGEFSVVFHLPAVNSTSVSSRALPIPTRNISLSIVNPGSPYTGGTVSIDEVKLI